MTPALSEEDVSIVKPCTLGRHFPPFCFVFGRGIGGCGTSFSSRLIQNPFPNHRYPAAVATVPRLYRNRVAHCCHYCSKGTVFERYCTMHVFLNRIAHFSILLALRVPSSDILALPLLCSRLLRKFQPREGWRRVTHMAPPQSLFTFPKLRILSRSQTASILLAAFQQCRVFQLCDSTHTHDFESPR